MAKLTTELELMVALHPADRIPHVPGFVIAGRARAASRVIRVTDVVEVECEPSIAEGLIADEGVFARRDSRPKFIDHCRREG